MLDDNFMQIFNFSPAHDSTVSSCFGLMIVGAEIVKLNFLFHLKSFVRNGERRMNLQKWTRFYTEVSECKWQTRNLIFCPQFFFSHLLCGSENFFTFLSVICVWVEAEIRIFILNVYPNTKMHWKSFLFRFKCRLLPTSRSASRMCVAFANIYVYW